MKTLIFIILVIFLIVRWDEVSSFVSAYASIADKSVTQWLVDHTPKK